MIKWLNMMKRLKDNKSAFIYLAKSLNCYKRFTNLIQKVSYEFRKKALLKLQ